MRDPHGIETERGVALVIAIFFSILISGLVFSGTILMKTHRAETETSFRLHGQAAQFARAGLTDALGWFRKSKTQPVTTFDPQLAPTATPPALETMDPDLGIVREFQISGPIWGRYEVWKKWDSDPDPQRLAWRQQVQAEDITQQSGLSGSGNAWKIESVGYVFRMVDPNLGFDQYPNRVVSTEILGSEIRRLSLAPPGQAALCARDASQTTIQGGVRIDGGTGAGVFSQAGTGSVTILGRATVRGSPGASSSSAYDDSTEAVFGVTEKDLQALADDYVTSATNFPSPVATNYLYFVDVPTLTFTDKFPLSGRAIVYVKGDVVFAQNTKSFFSGMLYVDGDLTMREPLEINGVVICTGSVQLIGNSDFISINYDDETLNGLRTVIGQYRTSAAIRRVLSRE